MPLFQGTYYARGFTITDTAEVAQDISTWEFSIDFRARLDGAELLNLTTANGGVEVTDGPGGRMEIRILAADTVDLPVGKLLFDVLRTDSSPGPTYLFGGSLTVRKPVTRDD